LTKARTMITRVLTTPLVTKEICRIIPNQLIIHPKRIPLDQIIHLDLLALTSPLLIRAHTLPRQMGKSTHGTKDSSHMLRIIGEHPIQQQVMELQIHSLCLEAQGHLVCGLVDTSVEQRLQGTALEGTSTTVDWTQPWDCQPMCMDSKEEHIQAAACSQLKEVLRGVIILCIQPMAFQEVEAQVCHAEVVVQEVEAHPDSQEAADHQEEDHRDHQEVVAVAVEVPQMDQE
jgi:hypothetical protein